MLGTLLKKLAEHPKQSTRSFRLQCDFGFEVTSPIPSGDPSHGVDSATVPAIPGTNVKLFPGKRPEFAEFTSYVVDELGVPCGIRCTVWDYPPSFVEIGFPKSPVQELELMAGEERFFDNSIYENGKRTYTFRKFTLLEDAEPRR